MKIKPIIFLLLTPCLGLCQQKETRPSANIYLDSIKVDIEKLSLSPHSIAKMDVTNNTPGGEIYFKLKRNTKFFNLSEITKSYLKMEDSDNALYIVDDNVVNNKEGIRIDSAIIKKVEMMNLANVDYLKKEFNQMIIVKVVFNTSKRPDDKDTIWIRGTK